jgi:hypothetical protein
VNGYDDRAVGARLDHLLLEAGAHVRADRNPVARVVLVETEELVELAEEHLVLLLLGELDLHAFLEPTPDGLRPVAELHVRHAIHLLVREHPVHPVLDVGAHGNSFDCGFRIAECGWRTTDSFL